MELIRKCKVGGDSPKQQLAHWMVFEDCPFELAGFDAWVGQSSFKAKDGSATWFFRDCHSQGWNGLFLCCHSEIPWCGLVHFFKWDSCSQISPLALILSIAPSIGATKILNWCYRNLYHCLIRLPTSGWVGCKWVYTLLKGKPGEAEDQVKLSCRCWWITGTFQGRSSSLLIWALLGELERLD